MKHIFAIFFRVMLLSPEYFGRRAKILAVEVLITAILKAETVHLSSGGSLLIVYQV